MLIQKSFRSNKDLIQDFSEICSRNGLSDSACLNRLVWLYVCNDSLIQSRVNDVSIVQQFSDAYGDK